MQQDERRLLDCFAIVFPNMSHSALRDASASTEPAWDSLATVTLVQLIEEEFGSAIEMEQIEGLNSFATFLEYVRRNHAAVS